MTSSRATAACLALMLTIASPLFRSLSAQRTPCRDYVCVMVFDWGSGSPTDNDRVFGSGTDFEAAFRGRLLEAGFKIVDAGTAGALRITTRIVMSAALCDPNPGLNQRKDCRTLGTAFITFTPQDTGVAQPKAFQVAPRCPDPFAAMKMTPVGRYTAEMLLFTLEGEQKKIARPAVKC